MKVLNVLNLLMAKNIRLRRDVIAPKTRLTLTRDYIPIRIHTSGRFVFRSATLPELARYRSITTCNIHGVGKESDQHWPSTAYNILAQFRADFGPALARHIGLTMARHMRPNAGPMLAGRSVSVLVQHWLNAGSTQAENVDTALAQHWCSVGPALAQHWPHIGPAFSWF